MDATWAHIKDDEFFKYATKLWNYSTSSIYLYAINRLLNKCTWDFFVWRTTFAYKTLHWLFLQAFEQNSSEQMRRIIIYYNNQFAKIERILEFIKIHTNIDDSVVLTGIYSLKWGAKFPRAMLHPEKMCVFHRKSTWTDLSALHSDSDTCRMQYRHFHFIYLIALQGWLFSPKKRE